MDSERITDIKKRFLVSKRLEQDRRSGRKVSKAEFPLEYAILRYRQYFHLSWQDVVEMPFDQFLEDWELMIWEQEIEEMFTPKK